MAAKNKKNGIGTNYINFQYQYDIEKFENNMFARNCFKHITIMKKKNGKSRYGSLLLSTSNKLLCMDSYSNLDSVDIIISSKYKLMETNADETNDRKYIWHFDRNNYQNKYIYLLLNTKKRDLTFCERCLEGQYFNVFTVVLLLLSVAGIVIFVLYKKGIQRNKI